MKITEKPFSIPDHWRWIELKELAEINPTFDRNDLSDDDPVSFVGMKRVEELSGRIDLSETEPLSEVRKGYTYFEDGDVLFAKITPCMENGKVAVARGLENGVGFGSTEFHVIRHPEEITQEWIFHYLIQEGFRRDAKRAMTGSAGQKRVPTGYIEEVPIPLPPLPEQRRIVAKIEELFSKLDAGMGDLQTAEQQLERYRLSVLQAAVEGRLTADWRRTHDPEPADQLLERILVDRREKWEERYKWERYESKGKEPPSGWKDRYTEPDPPDDTDLRELPEGWAWSKLGHAFFVHLGATPRRSRDDFWGGDIAWASSSEINQREITYTEETITEAGLEDTSTQVLPPGTLMLGMIGQGRTRGMVAELKIPAATSQNSAAIEVAHCSVPPKWVYYYLESQYHELRRMGSGNNQKALNKGIVQEIPIPLPPLAEQKQIVDEVERLLSVADDASDTADREHTRADRLRQSILKQAFSGQLVPHDDEANPPTVDTMASETTGTPSSNDRDSDAEDLLGSTDPDKQIEMDI
ncbi:type I restriction enzyme S subunit [Salinibacter ruber]|uniref:restriction endonuclease subunit S n=1 Tax=Salinibacter ruber TaxID=146919 RepID=UPI00216881C6|nr:restriction endonuclease subunit S [Salinibacter ruber]MCS3665629.1 type I restriction enzyme S subunit [Salinibacter ruber]